MALVDVSLTWFALLERRLWRGAVAANCYFASCVLAFVFAAGSLLASAPLLNSWLGVALDLNAVSLVALWVYVAALLLCESICVAHTVAVALFRSLLVAAVSLLMLSAGYLLAVAGLAVSLLWVLLTAVAFVRRICLCLSNTWQGRRAVRADRVDRE